MKPTFTVMLIAALAISACARTESPQAVSSAHAGAPAFSQYEPLPTLPPVSADAEDREIVDYQ